MNRAMRDAGWVREPIVFNEKDLMCMSFDERRELEGFIAISTTCGEVWREDGPFGTRIKIIDRPSLTDL